jgi:hypothetical protein
MQEESKACNLFFAGVLTEPVHACQTGGTWACCNTGEWQQRDQHFSVASRREEDYGCGGTKTVVSVHAC